MKALVFIALLIICTSCMSTFRGVDKNVVRGFKVLPHQTLLVVKVKSSEYTGLYPSGCEAGEDEICIPFYFWYIHNAEILNVVKGEYNLQNIKFAKLQHANFIKEITNEWYVLVDKIPNDALIEQLGTNYYAVRTDSSFFNEEEDLGAADFEKCAESIKVIERVAPQYPTDTMEEKEVQFVRMSFLVNLDGKVSEVNVLALSDRRFTRTAIKTIKKWLFEPQDKICQHEIRLEWVLSD
jgi:TonB family protein